MPTPREMFISCIAAVITAVTVVLVMHAIGLGAYSTVTAAISASLIAVCVHGSLSSSKSEDGDVLVIVVPGDRSA